jgi:hypothetical protein
MTDPLDLTIQHSTGPLVNVDLRGLLVPSPEAEVAPLWRTPAELAIGKRLIEQIKTDLASENDGFGDVD